MFEFNREFIINDNDKGPLTGGRRFEYDDDAKVLKVGKMVNIEVAKVHSIHKAPYLPEVSEKVILPLTGKYEGTLVITIGQEGRVISLVSDRLAHHTKDYIFNGTPAQWQAQFERQAAMEDMDRLIDVTVESDTLTIAAKDCYTRIEGVVYEATDRKDATPELSKKWTRVGEFSSLVSNSWTPVEGGFVSGTEGMGTVTRILKNMRLQTNAHLSAHGFDMDERPLPRGEYEQWTIQYVSERRHQSGEVFGSINHSLVTLIFFVEAGVTDWSNEIGKLATAANVSVCEVFKTTEDTPARMVDPTKEAAASDKGEDKNVYEQSEEVVIDAKKHKLSK